MIYILTEASPALFKIDIRRAREESMRLMRRVITKIQAREAEPFTNFVVMEGVRRGWNLNLLVNLMGGYKKGFKDDFKIVI